MKRILTCLLVLLFFIPAGCMSTKQDASKNQSSEDYIENHYVFKGESESWTGDMTIDSSLQFFENEGVLGCDSNEDSLLTVTYKGDVSDLASVRKLNITYNAQSRSGSIEESYDDKNPLQQKSFTISSGGEGALIQEDFIITVTVTIDGKTESFEMKNVA